MMVRVSDAPFARLATFHTLVVVLNTPLEAVAVEMVCDGALGNESVMTRL